MGKGSGKREQKKEKERQRLWDNGKWLLACLVSLIPYAVRLIRYSISIDTEMMINTPQRMLTSWLYHERPGLVISKHLFGQTTFHYYIEVAGALVCLLLACWIWKQRTEKLSYEWKFSWVFPLLFLTHPVMAEQFHFLLQSMEVAWALFLCLLAAGLAAFGWRDILYGRTEQTKGGRGRKIGGVVLSVLAMAWSFSSYQSFVPLYIGATAGIYLLMREQKKEKCWILAFAQIGTFMAGFLLSQIAAKIGLYISTGSFNSTAYVAGMVQWQTKSAIACIKELYHYGMQILMGQGIFYTTAYMLSLIGTILVWRIRFPKCHITYIFGCGILYLSPFLLPLYLGGADQVRAQLTLAFVIAFGWWYLIHLLSLPSGQKQEKHPGIRPVLTVVAAGVALIFAGSQWRSSWILSRTAYQVYQQERELTESICAAIEETNAPADAYVQIVGRWSPVMTEGMVQGETIGWSFYEWDSEKAYGSTERIIGLWNTLGYEYQTVDILSAEIGKDRAENMPVWPEKGSVSWDGDLVIVKISEP